MNESQLIAQALKMNAPSKHKRKVMMEIEPSPIDVSNDAISRIASKITKKPRKKPLRQWEPSDFVKYFTEALSNQSMSLERAGARDREDMAFLYDEFVRRIDERMNNTVLRDYLDWWTESHARKMFGQSLYVKALSNERFLDQFIKLKFGTVTEKPFVSAPSPEITHREIDAQTLYRMGGLPMLLRSKGIIVTASLLREKNDNNWLIRISQALQEFTVEAMQETMEHTTGKVYPFEDMVDFISIARPALEFHRIREYSGINYRDYFKG